MAISLFVKQEPVVGKKIDRFYSFQMACFPHRFETRCMVHRNPNSDANELMMVPLWRWYAKS